MNFGNFISAEMRTWMTDILFLVPNWKWIVLAAAIFIGFILQVTLKKTFRFLKNSPHVKSRLFGFFKYYAQLNIHRPGAWLITGAFWLITLNALGFPDRTNNILEGAIKIFISISVLQLAYLAVEALGLMLQEFVKTTENTLDDQLAPFITKSLKILVIILGSLIIIQNFGINVASLLAGLGLGGLALALAAQDTAANVFGSITIIADRPFQVGDHIKVGAVEGVVEEVGFRSTRIRTLYRSLLTMPNSVIAKENIDNLTARGARRIRHQIGVTYDTPPDKIKLFIEQLKSFIQNHAKIEKETSVVQFTTMGDFSLGILINFFVNTTENAEELLVQEELLFTLMKLSQELKVDFAFPTQTHLVKNITPEI